MTNFKRSLVLISALLLCAAGEGTDAARTVFVKVFSGITAPATSAPLANRGQSFHLVAAVFPTASADVTGLQIRAEGSYDNSTWFPITPDITTAKYSGGLAYALAQGNGVYPYVRVAALAVSATYPANIHYTGGQYPTGAFTFNGDRYTVSPAGGSASQPTGPAVQYVNPSTGSDANSGLSSAAPLRTVAKAVSRLPAALDQAYTINLADGTYAECLQVANIASPGWGFSDSLSLTIQGNTASPANVLFTGQCTYAAESIGVNETTGARFASNADVIVKGVKVAPTAASTYSIILDGARRVVLNNVIADGNVTNGIGVFWSALTMQGTITINNFTQWGLWSAFGRSSIVGQNPTMVLTPKIGTTASGCFHAELNSTQDIEGASGSITCNGQVTSMWDVDTAASVFTNLPLTANNSAGTPANSQIWFVHHSATTLHVNSTINATNFTHTCSVLEPASANQGPGGRTFTNVGAANLNLGGQCILF